MTICRGGEGKGSGDGNSDGDGQGEADAEPDGSATGTDPSEGDGEADREREYERLLKIFGRESEESCSLRFSSFDGDSSPSSTGTGRLQRVMTEADSKWSVSPIL